MGTRHLPLLLAFACAAAHAEHPLERLVLADPRQAIERGRAALAGDAGESPDARHELLLLMGRAAVQLTDDASLAEILLQLQADGDLRAEALAHLLRAERLRSRDRHEDALAEALAGAAKLEEAPVAMRAHADYMLCTTYVDNRRFAEAERHCLRAEAAWRAEGDEYHLARTENVQSFIPYYQGNIEAALPISERAWRRARRIDAPALASLIAANLAEAQLDQGRVQEALELSRTTLEQELASGRISHAADTRVNIARALHAMGRDEEALAQLATGIEEAERTDHRLVLHELYAARSRIAEQVGQLDLALEDARRIAELRRRPDDRASPDLVAELEARYRSREQALQIRSLEQEQRSDRLQLAEATLEAERQRTRGLMAGAAALVAIALVALLVWLLRTQRRLAARLQELSERDPLTGVENRRAFTRRLEEVFAQQRPRARLALMILDLDHFKSINDRFGHPFGDTVLLATVAAVRDTLEDACHLARLGGEEFALLCEDHDPSSAADLAERLRAAIAAMRIAGPRGEISISVSIGVAPLGTRIDQPGDWLRAADAALYRAKDEGRNRVVIDQPRRGAHPPPQPA